MKRLRSHWKNDKIRFYVGGEYGETNPKTGCKDGGIYRPHFHAILFGFNFPDRVPLRLLNTQGLEHSANLDKLWGYGLASIGKVSFESAAYVARYCMAKKTGDIAKTHYMYTDPETGEIIMREPEFNRMSLKPGIGHNWMERYKDDVYPADAVICRGTETLPPRYYDKLLVKSSPHMADTIKDKRISDGSTRRKDHTDKRNAVRNTVVNARNRTLSRE
ncbi:MAG: replication initiator protein [Microvirus sp.]|nr:MAG: replication initiator protein [Microvirus sp.]